MKIKIEDLYRDDMLSILYDMADELFDEFSWEKFRKVSRYACDWNSTHEGETEIFVDDWNDGTGVYLAIEDDIWKYEE